MVLLAAAGVIGMIAYFNARDDATVPTSDGPGSVRRADERPVVTAGNVQLLFTNPQFAAPLEALQRELAGSDEALAAVGQAVLVRRVDHLSEPVVALSARHRLDASSPDGPALRDFIEYWLGRTGG